MTLQLIFFEEVSEPEEMTDDDSNFSPSDLKIEFVPRKLIPFTLIKLPIFFVFVDLGGGSWKYAAIKFHAKINTFYFCN